MTDKEKLHQILSSLWKNDDSIGKMCYNQALQDVQTAIDLQEEPVSEELEDAAIEWFNSIKYKSDLSGTPINAFKAGAKWQKEQMMKEAIDVQVLENYDGKVIKYDETILDEKLSDCKVFDKVKLIIIKED